MDIPGIKNAVECGCVEWQSHALARMLERGISRGTVRNVLLEGELIENYPDDRPYQSALFLGLVESEPFHVVAAFDKQSNYCFIITAYRPDSEHFESDYRTRRKP